MDRLLRPHFRAVAPYTPIEPVEVLSRRLGIPDDAVIKLDGNENLYGPSPRALEALARCARYHIYPDPLQRDLRQALTAYTGLGVEHIVVGNGSDELIDLLMRLTLEPGDRVLTCSPTFGMYSFNAGVCAATAVDIPRDAAFAVDAEAVAAAVDERTKLILLPSPNNPSANLLLRADLLRLLETGVLVVVDEAYAEFAGETAADLVPHYENLVVLRTFSKWAGLAGLRVGYGLMAPRLAQLLDHIKPPYNVNVAGLVAALASLEDLALLQERVQAIAAERERLYTLLQTVPYLRPYPSRANFILCAVMERDARGLKDALAGVGIFIRFFDTPRLRGSVRISVGLPEHTDRLLAELRRM
ncbi:MAG: histidinol-phosphate transaminase [Chloroflexi bacterium]|nr:histidinol-phosphate transaminase [Chloroflexota bacterium]